MFASSYFSEFETESTYLSLSPLRRLNTPLRNARGTSHSLLSMQMRIRPIQQQACVCVILFHLCLCLLCKLRTTGRCPPCGLTSCPSCLKVQSRNGRLISIYNLAMILSRRARAKKTKTCKNNDGKKKFVLLLLRLLFYSFLLFGMFKIVESMMMSSTECIYIGPI